MTKISATAVSALALIAALSGSAYASDLNGGLKDGGTQGYDGGDRRVNWSGPYISGQAGYGISTGKFKTTTDYDDVFKHVDAAPSNCFADKVKARPFTRDLNDPETPDDDSDDTVGVKTKTESESKTNLTEEQCKDWLDVDEFGSEPIEYHDWKGTKTTGYTPEVLEHEELESAAHAVKHTDKSSEAGFLGGVRAGYDQQMGRIVLGAFGEYNWGGIEGHEGQWGLGGRGGFIVGDRTLLYGLVGYSQTEYDFGFGKSTSFGGVMVGGGVEIALANNIFLGAEYTHAFYDTEVLFDGDIAPGVHEKVEADVTEDRIMGRVTFKLNGGLWN